MVDISNPLIVIYFIDKIHVGACCPDAMIGELYSLLVPGGVLVVCSNILISYHLGNILI
jgi:hypothetical protein